MRAGRRGKAALVLALVASLLSEAASVQPAGAQAGERRAEAARLMSELMSGRHPVGGPFTLSAPDGRRVSLGDFRGKLVLLYFGYAYCPDVCPTDLAAIGVALEQLGAQAAAVQPLFVTLDPERDTPEVLREYAAAFHPRLIALAGSEAEVRRSRPRTRCSTSAFRSRAQAAARLTTPRSRSCSTVKERSRAFFLPARRRSASQACCASS